MDNLERAFRAAVDALDGITWWLTDGTALGAVRSGRVAGADVDLGVWGHDIPAVAAALAGRPRVQVREHEITAGLGAKVDIHGHSRTGDMVWYPLGPEMTPIYRFPAVLFNEFATVELYGVPALMPAPPERYLEAHYGAGWRTPRASWNYKRDAACIGQRPRG